MQNFVKVEIGAFESFGRKFYKKNKILLFLPKITINQFEQIREMLIKNDEFWFDLTGFQSKMTEIWTKITQYRQKMTNSTSLLDF